MKRTDKQSTNIMLRSIATGCCLSGIIFLVFCICYPTFVFSTQPKNDLEPVFTESPTASPTPISLTPLVKVGSFPIQDVESYATPALVLWDLSHSEYSEGDWRYITDYSQ